MSLAYLATHVEELYPHLGVKSRVWGGCGYVGWRLTVHRGIGDLSLLLPTTTHYLSLMTNVGVGRLEPQPDARLASVGVECVADRQHD